MDATEKRQIETQLLRMGLAGLQESGQPTAELVQQISEIVNRWPSHWNREGEWIDRHMFLRDLLAECEAKNRSEMYAAIVPYLNFTAHPLSHYENLITQRVSRLATRGLEVTGEAPNPIEVGGKKYRDAMPGESAIAMVTLHCQRCWKKKRFVSDTPAGAMIMARKAGWQRFGKETCPKCVRFYAN